MATAGDGAAPYEGGGAGGKFRKRPLRRSSHATPYDRPPTALRNNNPGLFTKLVDSSTRLIYAGAHRLFGAFHKRLPSLPPQRPPDTREEPSNGLQGTGPNPEPKNCNGASEHYTDQDGNLASISPASATKELEQMLKQKTFTRSEIDRLTALLHSRTAESPHDDDDDERNKAKLPSTSQLLRLEASTSSPVKKDRDERDILHAAISTPVTSRAVEEDIASPAELAKAYMGTRPTKVSPMSLGLSRALRRDSALLDNSSVLPTTPIMSVVPKPANGFRGLENGFTTPRSRGRSAIYSMARTPYSRLPSTFSPKVMKSDYFHGVASQPPNSSESGWRHEGPLGSTNRMALKRRSSVLDDDIGSVGPVRRIRQKANLLSQGSFLSKHKREYGSSSLQQAAVGNQKLLLMNEPEPKASKALEENGETSMYVSGYASVPTKSTQMASKILQQLERLTPKEKSSGSKVLGTGEKSPSKLTTNMLHGQALKSLEKVDSAKFLPSPEVSKKSENHHHVGLPDARESTSQSKDNVEENGPRTFAVPRNMLASVNGDSATPLKDRSPVVTTADSTLSFQAEPPQKKRAFQMSAHEDSWELDDDTHSNGHVPFALGENRKAETYAVTNKTVSAEALPGVSKTLVLPVASKTSALPEASKTSGLPEVAETSTRPEVFKTPAPSGFKRSDDSVSPPKADSGLSGGCVASEQKIGFSFPTSPPMSTSQPIVLSQLTSPVDEVNPLKESNAFPSFSTSTKTGEKASPFMFSVNQPSEVKSDAGANSMFNSVTKNDQVKFSVSNKDDNVNGQKPVDMSRRSEAIPSAVPPATSTSGIFQFAGSTKTSSIPNGPSASSSAMFSSTTVAAFGNDSSLTTATSSGGAVTVASVATTASGSLFSTSAAAPTFSFSSAAAPSSSTSTVPTDAGVAATNAQATNDNEPRVDSSSHFPSTSFATASTGSSFFGFSSPAVTSSTNSQSQGSFFNATSGSQANTQTSTALTESVPFRFGSSASTPGSGTSGILSTTSGSSPFGSSAPASSSMPSFGLSSAVSPSEAKSWETKSGSSASGPTTGIFGSTTASASGIFGSAWQPPQSSALGSTFSSPSSGFVFGASSMPTPSGSSFGSSNVGASTGSSMFSFSGAAPTNSSFAAPSQGQSVFGNSTPSQGQSVFGNSTPSQGQSVFGNSTPVFGAATALPNNNDQMSMEDSMAEDSMQTPSPPVTVFGQAPPPSAAPAFMFGSGNPTPPSLPFQFGGQPTQPQPQNPFQSSGSLEFNAGGGSFSLGSGGGDKAGRRIVKIKSKSRRK